MISPSDTTDRGVGGPLLCDESSSVLTEPRHPPGACALEVVAAVAERIEDRPVAPPGVGEVAVVGPHLPHRCSGLGGVDGDLGPRCFVGHDLVSIVFTPNAINDAHGCHNVRAFTPRLPMGRQ